MTAPDGSAGAERTDRLARLLGGPDTAWLVLRVRQRLARGRPLTGRVVLQSPTVRQRSAVQLLLGRPPGSGATLGVDLAEVDEVLRRSGVCPSGLADAVIALGGPVVDEVALAERTEAAWRRALEPLGSLDDVLAPWRDGLLRSGLVRRLAGSPEAAGILVADAVKVIRALPADGEPRGHLAARVVGHAHDLDEGRPLATLVFGAARVLSGVPDGSGAQWRREVWAAVGVLRDDLSSTVIALGLPGDPGTPLGRVLAEWHACGEPVTLTLRQLRRPSLARSLGLVGEVFVCENPVVVSMAADRGAPARPLLCISGRPGVAAGLLLHALAGSGAVLHYHGDFDWGGIRIANGLIADVGARPWRMAAADYERAATVSQGRDLTGAAVPAVWDPALAPAMSRIGRAIDEEHVVEDLLADLTSSGAGTRSKLRS